MLLSIVIPIYKVENYIIECIDSICSQMLEGVEVILVNDGTPDNSMEIAKNYIKENYSSLLRSFIFLDQKNQGQSVARNIGLKNATGEYIAFVDSDDVLVNGYLKQLLPLLGDVDIVQFKSARFSDNVGDLINFEVGLAKKQGIYQSSRDLMIEIFNQSAWFPWLNVYKRALFEDLCFPVGFYFEDAVLIPKVFLRAKTIYFLDTVMYLYRVNNEGSLLNPSKENIEKKLRSYEFALNTYVQNLNKEKIYSPSFVSMSQGYVSFVYKNFGFLKARIVCNEIMRNKKQVVNEMVKKRGNKLFFRYGMLFIVCVHLLGKS